LIRLPAVPLPVALLVAGALAGGIVALRAGFSPEWDMLNYHLYNPHALLSGRLAIDLAPAQMQTYLNPLFHLPHYLLFRHAPPSVLVFILGCLQGAQLILLWWLARRLLAPGVVPAGGLIVVALLGLGGPVFLSQLGVTQGDTVLSALVLGGLLLALPQAGRQPGFEPAGARAVALAGLLLGLATALKLVFGSYAAALGVAIGLCTPGTARWTNTLAYAGGAAAGLLLAGGPWFAYLWLEYQSPLFPYFNQLFQSDWTNAVGFRDLRFMPRTAFDWLAYPVVWLLDPRRVWEWGFCDLRPVLLLPAAAFVLLAVRRRLPGNLALLCVFVMVSYLLWLVTFSIYRYLAVLEMLAPLLLLALVMHWRADRRVVVAALALLLASQALVRYERPDALWSLHSGHASRLAELPDDAMVVIDGYAPVAFVALWLDDGVPLVRVRANFMPQKLPETRIHRVAEQRVRAHAGPVFLLLSPEDLEHPYLRADLTRLGFQWSGPSSCEPVFGDAQLQKRLGLQLCPLRRQPALFEIAGR
jgi:hypothetical protein